MSKPALGKGLGDLMNGAPAGRGLKPSGHPSAGMSLGRGLDQLVNQPTLETETARAAKRPVLPAWFFFSADVLLLGFTVAVSFDAPRPMDLGTMLFCAVSVGLGAVLAIAGVLAAAE